MMLFQCSTEHLKDICKFLLLFCGKNLFLLYFALKIGQIKYNFAFFKGIRNLANAVYLYYLGTVKTLTYSLNSPGVCICYRVDPIPCFMQLNNSFTNEK
ncbi:hypothetical protein EGR_10116 [Echinococcus granulosus]|uniref:Uncharacterized protein n=1 Tax=Echinococcus granulosus TaxID=6210 RepID=W6U1P8_ECHGR|nr:hypothetical protein EGR_10116 [Echinococcus granulosus]EUB55020.1 hypothetical protein EGR_10116 [Echinococcus granulosus]